MKKGTFLQVAWTLFILYPIRWAYKWLARATGSDEAPTPLFMTATILLVFASAFMTDVIGKEFDHAPGSAHRLSYRRQRHFRWLLGWLGYCG